MNNTHFFFGDNEYLKRKKLLKWKSEFIKKFNDFNFIEFDDSETPNQTIISEIRQIPFMSEKKIILIKDYFKKDTEEQKEIIPILENQPEHAIIIFYENGTPDKRVSLFKFLTKNCKVEEFKHLSDNQLIKFITEEATKNGSSISEKNAEILIQRCGINMNDLLMEITKLSTYKLKSEITENDIKELTTPKLQYSIFALTDAFSQKKIKAALGVLNEMASFHSEISMIFHMIARQVRILLQIKDCLEANIPNDQIASIIKEHPFTVKNAASQCKNFSMNQLVAIHSELLKIDAMLKSGEIKISTNNQDELKTALTFLIVKFCTSKTTN